MRTTSFWARRGPRLILAACGLVILLSVFSIGKQVLAARAAAQFLPNESRALPTIPGISSRSRIEPNLSYVAAAIARREVPIICWSTEDWGEHSYSGYTSHRPLRIHLSPDVCEGLTRLAYRHLPVRDEEAKTLAFAVLLLTHEAVHARGYTNEAQAECYGMQLMPAAGEMLGATPGEAQRLASLYWQHWYPKHKDTAYHSDACRNNGGLDLWPETDVWP